MRPLATSNFFTIANPLARRQAYLLLIAGTLSFLAGLVYGSGQRYEKSQYYPLIAQTLPDIIPDTPFNPVPSDVTIKIKAVGDIVPGTNYPSNQLHPQKTVL